MLMKQLYGLFKLLNSDKGTNQIAAGIACGFILGMSPILSLQALLVFFLMFFFRIQIGAAFLFAAFFKGIAYLLDPAFHELGSAILELPSLQPLYTQMYNMPLVPFTRFNNSIVMGAGVFAIAMTPVVFFIGKKMIATYRDQIVARFEKTRLWQGIKASGFYQWYAKYEELKNG
ncbi:MAG: TIGR03546 family protein [Bdellovibrionales bacterium]|nr:TIGR03546 family protein [Bdellovibrionales bacterium]